jgi:hypothetical protein
VCRPHQRVLKALSIGILELRRVKRDFLV